MKAFENNIRKVKPYIPGEQPKRPVIKLNTNENPYPPAPGVKRVLREMNADRLRLYPDPAASDLVKELAEYYHVAEDQVFVGVGSDDVLAMCFLTFFHSEKPVLFPDITYSFYKVWAELYRIPYVCPPLDENFRIRREDYCRENGGIIFPNPNAPTSLYENLEFVEDILKANPDSVVIVDEAYIDFAGPSALRLLPRYDNLIVTQTFSKARSMAGMRIGYAVASPLLIRYLNDAKYSFNSYTMNQVSILSGVEAVRDRGYFVEHVQKITETRDWTAGELKQLGFEFPEPGGNFIFAKHPACDGTKLYEALREHDIFVRHWEEERIRQYMRITIGTREEMEMLVSYLKQYLAGRR